MAYRGFKTKHDPLYYDNFQHFLFFLLIKNYCETPSFIFELHVALIKHINTYGDELFYYLRQVLVHLLEFHNR